jgi:hypothetical protein
MNKFHVTVDIVIARYITCYHSYNRMHSPSSDGYRLRGR